MKHKFVGIVICILLIANISVVLGMPKERVNTNGEGRYFIFEDSSGQREIKYIEIDDKKGNDLPKKIITNTNDNLAPNPSFEEGDTMPTGWTYSIDDRSKYHWDSNFSHTGEKSIGALNLTETTSSSCWITADFIPVDLVKNAFEFSGWYKSIGTPTKGQYAFFDLYLYDEEYHYLGGGGPCYDFSSEWNYSYESTSNYGGTMINETKYIKLGLCQTYFPEICPEPDPLIEVRFDDIYFGVWNTAPNTPTITGETNGKIRILYNYTITTIDPDQDNVSYEIDWGDNTTQTTAFYKSGEEAIISHRWDIKGTYRIRIKAIDDCSHFGLKSDWANLTITMPCSYKLPFIQYWMKLIERFPNTFPLLRQILGY